MVLQFKAVYKSLSDEWMRPSLRYEGVDWRDPSRWDCGGARGDPFAETAGGSLSLDEALFVKIKEGTIQTSSSLAQMAAKYERWMEDQVNVFHSQFLLVLFIFHLLILHSHGVCLLWMFRVHGAFTSCKS